MTDIAKEKSISTPTPAVKRVSMLAEEMDRLDALSAHGRDIANQITIAGLDRVLEKPRLIQRRGTSYVVLNALNNKAFKVRLEETTKFLREYGRGDISVRLEGMRRPIQELYMGSATMAGKNRRSQKKQDDVHRKLDAQYTKILKINPSILMTRDDISAANDLGEFIAPELPDLREKWRGLREVKKILTCRDIWKQVFVHENVDNITLGVPKYLGALGVCTINPETDTLLLSHSFVRASSFDDVAAIFAHEYNHRRQGRLIQKLEQREIGPGDDNYWKARYLRANAEGGYILPSVSLLNPFRRAITAGAYYSQPLERDANGLALMTAISAGMSDKAKRQLSNDSGILRGQFYRGAGSVSKAMGRTLVSKDFWQDMIFGEKKRGAPNSQDAPHNDL